MILLFNNKLNSVSTLVPKSKIYNNSIRNLMRATMSQAYARMGQGTVLSPFSYGSPDSRGMGIIAQKFKPSYAKKDHYERDAQGITYHEGSHVILYDDQTHKVVGLLTSAKGYNLPPGVYIAKVSSEKYDGTFIPKINVKTKLHVLDSQGNLIPDSKKGGQYLAVFPVERAMSKESRGYLLSQGELEKAYPYLKSYLQKYQSTIQQIIQDGQSKNDTKTKLSKKLGGKDDEQL